MSYLADKRVLVLVADAARARLFAANNSTEVLDEIETLVNGSAHLRGTDLQTDRAGRRALRHAGQAHPRIQAPAAQCAARRASL